MKFYKGNIQRTRTGMLDFEWPMCPPVHAAIDEVKAVWMSPGESLGRWSKRRWRARWNNCSNESATSRLEAAFEDMDSDGDSWWNEPDESGQSKRDRFIAQYLFVPNSESSVPGQSHPCPTCNADGYVVILGSGKQPRPTHAPYARAVPYEILDKDTYVISDEPEITSVEKPQLELTPVSSESEQPKLPGWLVSAKVGQTDKAELHEAILDILEAVKGERPTKRYSTAGKACLDFYRQVREDYDDDPIAWAMDVCMVVKWAQQSTDKQASKDIRAEGWADGTDRSRDIGTLLRRERWADRRSMAIRWHDSRGPQIATLRGPESIQAPSPTLDPCAELQRLVRAYGERWSDRVRPELESRQDTPGYKSFLNALAKLGGAFEPNNLLTDDLYRFVARCYHDYRGLNDWKVSNEFEPRLRKVYQEESKR